MKYKKYLIVILLIIMCFVFGCNSINNDIYNKSYSVSLDVIELQNTLNATVEKAKHAVLGVSNYKRNIFTLGYTLDSQGSGVIYNAFALLKDDTRVDDITLTKESDNVSKYCYYLVTNYHVVEGAAKVCVYDGEEDVEIDGQLLGTDRSVDLAVIYFEYAKYIEPLMFADSSLAKAGDFVISIGSPYGYEYYGTASFGIISNTDRILAFDSNDDGKNDYDTIFIQHDSPINSGNSGGPLINIYGEIVGINSQKIADRDADNMGFAIPSNTVSKTVEKLASGSTPKRASLSMQVSEIRGMESSDRVEKGIPEDLNYGLFVDSVNNGSFKDAGVKSGDILLSINGVRILYTYTAKAELKNFFTNNGESTVIIIYRDGEYLELTIYF